MNAHEGLLHPGETPRPSTCKWQQHRAVSNNQARGHKRFGRARAPESERQNGTRSKTDHQIEEQKQMKESQLDRPPGRSKANQ